MPYTKFLNHFRVVPKTPDYTAILKRIATFDFCFGQTNSLEIKKFIHKIPDYH